VDVGDLTPATQDYLKALWSLGEWDAASVTVTALAERLGVRTSTASDGLRKLVDQGFVEHAPYGAIVLTASGRAHAIAMVRRHRLLETYLVQQLGYTWDEVHDEAESLEHAVSERFMTRVDSLLGHPTRDPHGDPIPSASGDPHLPPAVPLASLEPGSAGVVARISDADPGQLREFAAAGVVPDAVVTVGADGAFSVGAVQIGADAAAAVWVIPT
jgi:DtxR family Mn-dependent transcriptional regulator